MKRRFTFLLTFIMTLSIFFTSAFPASAAENSISPRLSNSDTATVSFVIDSSTGIGHFSVDYTGKAGVFTQAKVTVKLQKRFLWVFWNEVDSWTATSTDISGDFYTYFTLEDTGTYRAAFTLEFYGTSGTVDVIEDYMERTY